jgi:hypothetical protein
MRVSSYMMAGVLVVWGCVPAAEDADGSASDTGVVAAPDFESEVFPTLERHCTDCHDNSFTGDFNTPDLAFATLTDPSRVVGYLCGWAPDELVPVITPGDRERSGLWLVSIGTCDAGTYGMPKYDPDGLLIDIDPDAVDRIGRWIDAGAAR